MQQTPSFDITTTPWRPLPEGTRGPDKHTFAIGDVHGREQALNAALGEVSTLTGEVPFDLVFLGDLIDRGPGGLAAIRHMRKAKDRLGADSVVFLPGNHELMLLDFLEGRDVADIWLMNGGMAMLDELATTVGEDAVETLEDAMNLLRGALPDEWFNNNLKSHFRTGDLLFVHAGISPSLPLEMFLRSPSQGARKQVRAGSQHWAWIREPFLRHDGPWPQDPNLLVVHGHTPALGRFCDDAEVLEQACLMPQGTRRVCLDGGASVMEQVIIGEFTEGRMRLHVVGQNPGWLPT